jgi:hypothetical protein
MTLNLGVQRNDFLSLDATENTTENGLFCVGGKNTSKSA